MNKLDQGVIMAATILCQLDYWREAAEMLAETGAVYDMSRMDEFDREHMAQLKEKELKALNGCLWEKCK